MRTRFALRMLAAAALTLAAGSAAAAVASTASMRGFSFALYDLDLNDGIAPSIDFDQLSTATFIEADMYSATPRLESLRVEAIGEFPGTPLAFSFTTLSQYSAIHAQVTGGGRVPTFESMTVGGSVDSIADYAGRYNVAAYFPYPNINQFILSANTLVQFSLTATASAVATVGQGGDGRNEEAHAAISLGIWGGAPGGGPGSQSSEASLGADLYHETGNVSNQALLSASFVNLSDASMNAAYAFRTEVHGSSTAYSPVPGVPEPASYAMLLSGLALAGARARRRRDRDTQ